MGKVITFIATIDRGAGDTIDWEFEYEVDDETYIRLRESAENNNIFSDDEDIEDIYEEVLEAVIAGATEDILDNEYDDIAEMLEEEGRDIDEEDWSADELYGFSVRFPDNF